jgi:acyl-CoA synthetase (AMP-forming)/AMP-acid ligase II
MAGASLSQFVHNWAGATPDKIALIDADRAVTYAELETASARMASALRACGLDAGARVGYLGKNTAAFFEIWVGANRASCALTPLNWRSSARELAVMIDDARPAIVFVGDGFDELIEHAFALTDAQPAVIGLADLESWLSDRPADDAIDLAADANCIALLAYTSGTTAAPKGVAITNAALAEWFRAAALDPATAWSAADTGLMVMPNFHLAGTWVSVPALFHGATLVVLPAFEPISFLAAVRAHRVTVTCLVPTAIHALLQHVSELSGSQRPVLRRVLYAGSPIDAETLGALIDTFDCDLVQFYGTTETFIICLLRPSQHRGGDPQVLTSCGQPMVSVQLRIVDRAGFDVIDGRPGEVVVKSPWMFDGYWNNPDATAAAITDGWYHTGDVGYRDASGNVHLVDRLKDMIVSGGENVYCAEVERALASYPTVAAVAVVGAPDPKWGERVVAFVVPAVDAAVNTDELISHCRQRIAGYKVPKDIYVIDELPMTGSGKVSKGELRHRIRTREMK